MKFLEVGGWVINWERMIACYGKGSSRFSTPLIEVNGVIMQQDKEKWEWKPLFTDEKDARKAYEAYFVWELERQVLG
jgi:hypothetical protein